PADQWLRGHLLAPLKERLLGAAFRRHELLEESAVEALVTEHEEGLANHGHLLWGLLSLAAWAESVSSPRALAATLAPPRAAPMDAPATPAFNFA
ncbi:MAG: asparagine synthase-related protein, partial [Planctomycetes bacterium]|nr:asparagine synthase-related protein [Planctomycetota bacterium]